MTLLIIILVIIFLFGGGGYYGYRGGYYGNGGIGIVGILMILLISVFPLRIALSLLMLMPRCEAHPQPAMAASVVIRSARVPPRARA